MDKIEEAIAQLNQTIERLEYGNITKDGTVEGIVRAIDYLEQD